MDTRSTAMKDTSPAGAVKVTEIGWWCDNATEAANFEVGIYDHNVGDDNPENLVGSSTVNAKGTTSGWKRSTGLSILISAETVYWIAIQVDDTATATLSNDKADASEKVDIKTSQSALPDPWGSSNGSEANLAGFYAVYEMAAAGGVKEGGSINKDTGLHSGNSSINV